MYSDASGSVFEGGFGVYCGPAWTAGKWNPNFMIECRPSIEYLELYALTVGVLLWLKNFRNSAICLFCDNESVKYMKNDTKAKCKKLHGFTAPGGEGVFSSQRATHL